MSRFIRAPLILCAAGRACSVCSDSSVQLCDAVGNRMTRTNLTQHGCGTPR
jgi:hypothetical protein